MINWTFPPQRCVCGALVSQNEAFNRFADGVFVGWRHEECQ